jgi:hypothetical protein
MGLVILYLGVGFVQQARVSYERREELGLIEQEIMVVQEENDGLQERLNYVRSSEAAEEWARENGWAKEDEVSVVVVAPPADSSAGVQQDTGVTPAPGSNREAWWDFFFGER